MNHKKQPRILLLCTSQSQGGLELYVKRSALIFKQQQINYRLAISENSFLATEFKAESEHLFLSHTKTRPFPLKKAHQLANYIDQEEIDIIHMHFGKDLPLAVLAKSLTKRNVKLIYSRHMHITHRKFDFYHRWLYKAVDLFLCVTEEVCEQARQKIPINSEKIKCLYLGVPAMPKNHLLRADAFQELGLDPTKFTIVIFGRIEAPKGQHLLLQAFKSLCGQGFDLQLVIIGHIMDSDYADYLQKNIKLSPSVAAIRFISFMPEPMRWMGVFDVLVAGSYRETFGLVLPEAMRCKTTVIGANSGGIREIVDHNVNGLLFETRNTEDLIAKLRYLIENPEEKRRLAQAGFEKAEKYFNQDTHFAELFRIYAELGPKAI